MLQPSVHLMVTKMKLYRRLCGCLAILLAGCATIYEGKYDYDLGWREGRIQVLGTSESLPGRWPPICNNAGVSRPAADSNVAGVAYRQMQMPRRLTVVVPDATFKIGDLVYLNKFDCSIRHRRSTN